jgi:hypothetical protein
MAKYYSLMLSKNISKTPEGYLICENVPLCRSGFQEYLGKELVGFPGYDPDWGLEPDTRYKVFRPKNEVLDKDFIKSLEGKTAVDEHPSGKPVLADNERELHCGHVQNIKPGPEVDDEVTLQGDIHIKDPALIEKVYPENNPDSEDAVRDVSLGYSLVLKRLDDGTIVMTKLRGNHVAIVEKGRAGPLIAIKDSAIPEVEFVPPQPETKSVKKENTMSLMDKILGLGWKQFATDASPEEIVEAAKELKGSEVKEPEKKKDDEPHAEHMAACKGYCDAGGDKEALMSFLKGEHKPAHDADESLEDLEEQTGNSGKGDKTEGEEEQDEKPAAEEDEKMVTDADEINDPGESVLKQANDSVREYIKSTKPIVAVIASKPKAKRTQMEQLALDGYNGAVKSLNAAKVNPYKALAVSKIPEKLATDSSSVTKTEGPVCTCFEGVPYRVGMEKHQNTCLKENK